MFSRLAANEGFNTIRALAGKYFGGGTLRSAWEAFGMAGREMSAFGGYVAQSTGSVPIGGKVNRLGAAKRGFSAGRNRMGEWARGMDLGPGVGKGMQRGVGAARVGGSAAVGAGAADFMNPWGFGWGD